MIAVVVQAHLDMEIAMKRWILVALLCFSTSALAQKKSGPFGNLPVFVAGQNGVVADGTDQTASLQALLQRAYDAGGGTIQFSAGTYLLSKRIVIPNDITTGTTAYTPATDQRPRNRTIWLRGIGCWKTGLSTEQAPTSATVFDMRATPISFTDGATATGEVSSASLGNYTYHAGDVLHVTGGTGITADATNYYPITGKTGTVLALGLAWPQDGLTDLAATIVQPAQIVTRGDGLLGISDIAFTDGGSTSHAFIHTTSTTLDIRNCSFYGRTSGTSADEDAIILGADAGQIGRLTSVTWTATTKRVSHASFANYVFRTGDKFKVTGGTDTALVAVVPDDYVIDGKVDATTLLLHTSITADVTATGNSANVTGNVGWRTDPTDLSAFQGYGTVIDSNYFNRIRRGVWGRTACNGVQITNNTFWWLCGGTTASAAIHLQSYANENNTGNYIAGNLIESRHYPYTFLLVAAQQNVLIGNNLFDQSVTTSTYYKLGADAKYNLLIYGYHDDTRTALSETETGTNTVITAHQGQRSTFPQYIDFTSGVAGAYAFKNSGGVGPQQIDSASNNRRWWMAAYNGPGGTGHRTALNYANDAALASGGTAGAAKNTFAFWMKSVNDGSTLKDDYQFQFLNEAAGLSTITTGSDLVLETGSGKNLRISRTGTLAAAGASLTDANPIVNTVTMVTSDGATKGVKLPTAVAGAVYWVRNTTATDCVLYANTDDNINGAASITLPANAGCMVAAKDATDWYTIPKAPS